MYDFEYHRPDSLASAVALRGGAADGTYLAGGMTLIPTLKQRLASPSDIIDLAAIPGLAGVTVQDDLVVVGAMTRHADVASSADVKRAIPALAYLAAQIGDAQVRNRGTVGGSRAHADPAADWPAVMIALKAEIVVVGSSGERRVAADDFFTAWWSTAKASPAF